MAYDMTCCEKSSYKSMHRDVNNCINNLTTHTQRKKETKINQITEKVDFLILSISIIK